jgi:hypothetical protein
MAWKRTSLRTLPENVRAELDDKIARDSYGTIDALVTWLGGKTHPRSRSSIHRYVQDKHKAMIAAGPSAMPRASASEVLAEIARLVGQLQALIGPLQPPKS